MKQQAIRPPNKAFTLARLKSLKEFSEGNPEIAHIRADLVLLDYINDTDIQEAYEEILKYYGRNEQA